MRAEDYTWFLTLASVQNLSYAADLLAIPQPTLSRRLARLEERVGAELFDRGRRRLRLNDRGRVIEAAFRDAQQSLDRGEAELRRLLDPETGRVRFGFLPSLGPWLAPRVIRSFLSRHPKADVVLSQATADALVMALQRGELDVALSAPDVVPELLGGLKIHTVHRQAMAIVVPEGHRLAQRQSVRFEEIVGESFVAAPPGYTTRNILDRLARGTKLRIVLESESLATHAGLASSGIGLALLPVDDPSLHVPGAVFLPLDTNDKREIALVWRPRAEDVPVVASFVTEVSSEFRDGL